MARSVLEETGHVAHLWASLADLVRFQAPAAHSAVTQPQGTARHPYEISAKLFDNKEVVGAPRLRLRENEPATVTIDRDGGYSMKVTVRESPRLLPGHVAAHGGLVAAGECNSGKVLLAGDPAQAPWRQSGGRVLIAGLVCAV